MAECMTPVARWQILRDLHGHAARLSDDDATAMTDSIHSLAQQLNELAEDRDWRRSQSLPIEKRDAVSRPT